jgi:hypothetical protein
LSYFEKLLPQIAVPRFLTIHLHPIRLLRTMSHTPPKNIVIIGGGIVGVSTAYFLSKHPNLSADTHITIVEGSSVAASGLSGGFLAKDWHGAATISLSTMSFDLHKKLADDFGGKENWGYRAVDTLVSGVDSSNCSYTLTGIDDRTLC